ncbi:hypothetical protein [Lysinibacillus sp. SGAir0095]|uniref:hypothetical protein n=1 Tax=Lysinibacillus sp. SGAir0095 TaxID=2070463 RepID=UPI00143DB6F9|nr:hypothetical protein [Lysinibacillus sp. SGAir0095]
MASITLEQKIDAVFRLENGEEAFLLFLQLNGQIVLRHSSTKCVVNLVTTIKVF